MTPRKCRSALHPAPANVFILSLARTFLLLSAVGLNVCPAVPNQKRKSFQRNLKVWLAIENHVLS